MNKSAKRVLAVFLTIIVMAGLFYGCGHKENLEGLYIAPDGYTYITVQDVDSEDVLVGFSGVDGSVYAAYTDEKGNVLKDGETFPVNDYGGTLPYNDTTAVSIDSGDNSHNWAGDDVVTLPKDPTSNDSGETNNNSNSTGETDKTTVGATDNTGNTPGNTTGNTNNAPSNTTGSTANSSTGNTTNKTTDTTSDKETSGTTNNTTGNTTNPAGTAGKPDDTTDSGLLADKYKTLFASGTFYIEFSTEDEDMPEPITAAIKNGSIYMKTKFENMNCTLIYQKDNDKLYMVLTDYRVYCKMPSDMMEELDLSNFSNVSGEVESTETYEAVLGGRECQCESYYLKDGSVSTFYFYNGELVRMDQIHDDGTSTVMNINKISSQVDDSLFVLPKLFIPIDLSRLDFDDAEG